MKTVSISGSLRENVGKKDAKKHRIDGKVPCVLYGGKDQVHFVTDQISFKKLVYSPDAYTVKLNVNSKEYQCYFAGYTVSSGKRRYFTCRFP